MSETIGSDTAAPTGAEPAAQRPRGFFTRRTELKSASKALQPEAAPPPPPPPPQKRRRGGLSSLSGFLTFLLVAALAGLGALAYGLQAVRRPGPLQANKVVVISQGTDVPDIIAQLEREGVIDNSYLLSLALFAEGTRSKLRFGEYEFRQNASLRDVMDTLVSGHQVLHAVTVPEGLTSEQIVQRLRENDILAGEVKDVPKEGTLLPETYKFSRGMTRDQILLKMSTDQRRVLQEVWARRAPDLPVRTPYDLVTLASIVEKETGRADERSRVAGVFINRLQKRMRLQSDPTIVYGLVGGKGTLGRGITRSELERPTPYNTYTIDGLPPGPIANPGRAALEAVANPSRTSELYFVADGTGGHVFADTLDQHQKNVMRWRQIEKDARDRLMPDADKGGLPGPAPGPTRQQRTEIDAAPPAFGTLVVPAETSEPRGRFQAREQIADFVPRMPDHLSGTDIAARRWVKIAAATPISKNPLALFPIVSPLASQAIAAAAPTGAAAGDGAPVPQTRAYVLAPGIDELGIGIKGVTGTADPEAESGADLLTYPVSPQRRAEQKARSARLGLEPGGDFLPPEATPAEVAPPNDGTQLRKARYLDASEGTALDPLRDKTYDLSYPKTVPAIVSPAR